MKANFKKTLTAIAVTAMCLVPMAGSMTASASERSYSLAKADKQAEEADIAELLKSVGSEDVALVKGTASYTLLLPREGYLKQKEAEKRLKIWMGIHGGDPIYKVEAVAGNSVASIGSRVRGSVANANLVPGYIDPDYIPPREIDPDTPITPPGDVVYLGVK